MRIFDLNLKLAKMLVGEDLDRVSGFDLRVRVNEIPVLTVYKEIFSESEVETEELHFTLIPKDEV